MEYKHTKIIKNWLDKDLANYLKTLYTYNFPHFYGHSSTEKGDLFYSTYFDQKENLNKFLIYKLKQTIKTPFKIKTMNLNIQHPGMEGAFHKDDCSLTALYMVTGEGDLELKDSKIIFKENNLIILDSSKLHRGRAPKKGVRITLAFKLI